ncbi:MAG: hypothetical protein JW735_04135, partial [Prolixibacteraceae bacterium]|nr:hypothetical protein [Prolixibacteraceae bacterium]
MFDQIIEYVTSYTHISSFLKLKANIKSIFIKNIVLLVFGFFSCTTQFEDDYKGALVFSSDTVSFDTIF